MARNRRQKRSQRRSGLRIDRIVSVPAGPNIRSASVEDVMKALEAVPAPDDWPGLAPLLVPMFQRLRPYDGAFPDALRVVVPPGISVSIGVDVGPALMHVTPEIAETWGVDVDEIVRRALANVAKRAEGVPSDRVFRHPIGPVMSAALQSGTGSASTFVLQPAVLPRLFGPDAHLFLAPMRDLLIALPVDVEREFALWVYEEFALQDPNCLAPLGFIVREGAVAIEPLEPEFAVA
jgi:hypothetical protein